MSHIAFQTKHLCEAISSFKRRTRLIYGQKVKTRTHLDGPNAGDTLLGIEKGWVKNRETV